MEEELNPPDPEDCCPECGTPTKDGKVCKYCRDEYNAEMGDYD